MKLSILVPGIRPQNWRRLYESINVHDHWEIIFVGPTPPPEDLKASNIKFFRSWRSPCACQQIALHYAVGEYVTWAADDGFYMPGALTYALGMAEYKTLVVGKYQEGDSPHPDMEKEEYYTMGYHKAYRLKGIPPKCLIFNCGVISRRFLMELGGWDAETFEVPCMAHADLSIRAYRAGAEMILQDQLMFKCSHMPGKTGDHSPIDIAQNKHDIPNFKKLYSKPSPPPHWRIFPILWVNIHPMAWF